MRGITDIHHVIYGHPDLDAAERFYHDFGMMTAHRDAERLYLRGTAPAPYIYVARRAPRTAFIAVALAVESTAALRRCAAIPGAAGPEPLMVSAAASACRCAIPTVTASISSMASRPRTRCRCVRP
jgi:catechol 2,3-dioxygenase-like lactoylglutathione lyase family enzyme